MQLHAVSSFKQNLILIQFCTHFIQRIIFCKCFFTGTMRTGSVNFKVDLSAAVVYRVLFSDLLPLNCAQTSLIN